MKAMHLLHIDGLGPNRLGHQEPVGCHMVWIVAHVVAQIQAVPRWH